MKKYQCAFLLFVSLFFAACQDNGSCSRLGSFCKGELAENFDPNFKVSFLGIEDGGTIPLKYTCSKKGEGISPPISWKGIPKSATHLKIIVEDATCTYMCNSCCKYHHFHCDIPLNNNAFAKGIPEGANKSSEFKPFIFENSSNKKEFMPFCPPKGQTHAIVIQLTAYHKTDGNVVIDGKSQSAPYLVSLE